MRSAARAAFARRDPGSQVAEEVAPSPTLGHAGRRLSFAAPGTRVDVRVRRTEDALVLLVHIDPRREMAVRVRHAGPDLTTRSRPDGRCRLWPVRPGPVSLVISGEGHRTATAWTCLGGPGCP